MKPKPMTAAELFDHLQRKHRFSSITRPLKTDMQNLHYRMHHPLLPAHDHDLTEWELVSLRTSVFEYLEQAERRDDR